MSTIHTDETPASTEIPLPVPRTEADGGMNGRGPLSSRVALRSDVGRVRERNEDNAFVLVQERLSTEGSEALGLFILADGAGGSEDGARASLAAVHAASDRLIRDVLLPFAAPNGTAGQPRSISESIERAFQEAQRQVAGQSPGGATTLTAALLTGRRITVGHAGDCRLYLLRGGELTSLTRDHSILARLVEVGQIDRDEADRLTDDPRRHTLYMGVMQSGSQPIDLFSRVLEPGDGLLLCSDGLWGSVPAADMREIIVSARTPQSACQNLVDAANSRGGPDNITAILVYPVG